MFSLKFNFSRNLGNPSGLEGEPELLQEQQQQRQQQQWLGTAFEEPSAHFFGAATSQPFLAE